MDSHETWAAAVGGGGKHRRCPPLKNHENKGFATYSSLWGAFSLLFFTYRGSFSTCGGFFDTLFTLWEAFLRCGGLFSVWEAFFGLPPTLRKFLRVPMCHAMTSI